MESITLSLGLIPIFLFGFLCLMLFIVSDVKEKLMILAFFILIAISFCIVKSDTMHDFIQYLHDIGFVNSIYWLVFMGIQPIIALLFKPLVSILRKKTLLVKISILLIFIVPFWIIMLVLVGNLYFGLSKL
ncbi:MAG: hypothetical protein E7K77_09840 [Veillonella parvula]|jgi:hypothetical protein|uniref:hypothetical protein n=2 Tax=Veillonella parvula TaxID=29466 RepID=UPI00290F00F3|nr:hypothetical protein [Veillonella parvula]MDU5234675.1 hypothetical protein [Staphylococcus sp.]MDU7466252.1 hypothetical protein [Veillonella parvula]